MSEPDPIFSELHGLDPGELFVSSLNPVQPPVSSPMIVRISAQKNIRYINSAFATYLGATVEELTGQPIEVAKQFCSQQVAECLDLETVSLAAGGLITDAAGRVFEPLVSLDAGVLDVILTEVTPGTASQESFSAVADTTLAELGENELRTFRNPETADISILTVRIHSLDALARNQSRHDMRILLDAIEEEFIRAIASYSGAIAAVGPGCFLGIFGAPQRFPDHALRAVLGATELQAAFLRLAAAFAEDGKSFPQLGLGIWTGEALVGALGGQRLGAYSAIGAPVQAALELSNLGREGEVLLGEPTLAELIAHPPDGWMFQSAVSESGPDLSDFQWHGSTILPLSEELSRLRCEMVPAGSPDGPVQFTLEYLWNLQPVGAEEPVPVVRILAGGQASSVISLQETPGEVQGHALGRYNLLKVLGVGGMGQVWLAKDRFGHPIAIKILHTHGTPSIEALKRFRREGEIMAKLHHRSICRIHEMNEVDGVSFIAMEYVSGISLSDLLSSLPESTAQKRAPNNSGSEMTDLIRSAKRKRSAQTEEVHTGESSPAPEARSHSPLPVEQALMLFVKICEAVQFAHEQGVLHRDLKPANILLRDDGEPLVADFGLAKLVDGDEEVSLSLTGNVVGTIQNMAPEQADSSKHVDERADIYSLGSILYRMLTGHPHFVTTGNIVVDGPKLQEYQPIRLRIHNPAIDADLETIVLKCLQPEPLRRYRRVHALWEDLDRYLRGEPIAARPISVREVVWKQVLRHKAVSALSAIFLIVLGIGTVAAFWQITQRAQAAQTAAAEAEEQRQLALLSKKDAEDKQTLAEQREGEAKESAKLAQEREKEAQEALAALQKAKAETEKEIQLRRSAEENAEKLEQLRRTAEIEAKRGIPSAPELTLLEKYRRKDVSLQEDSEVFRKAAEKALKTFLNGLSVVNFPEIATYGSRSMPNSQLPSGTENLPDGWSLKGKGRLPDDLVSKLRQLNRILAFYTLCDPEHGLPLLLCFRISVLDVNGAIAITESMKKRGMTPSIKVTSEATAADLQLQLERLKEKGTLESQFFQIYEQILRSVQIQPSLKVSVTTFHENIFKDIFRPIYSPSPFVTRSVPYFPFVTRDVPNFEAEKEAAQALEVYLLSAAEALGDWNPEAVVAFEVNRLKAGGVSVRAAGKGVVNIAPLIAWDTIIKALDLSYSSLPLLPPWSAFGLERLIARHSALRGFEEEDGRIKGSITMVKVLDISYSQFSSVEQILKFENLVSLQVAGIPAKDVNKLFTKGVSTSLNSLDMMDVPISSFSGVSRLGRLRLLRFSPELLRDKTSIEELRKMNLTAISTPQDQPNQPAGVFWAKWDNGDYAK